MVFLHIFLLPYAYFGEKKIQKQNKTFSESPLKHSLPLQNELDLYYVYLYVESIVIVVQLWCYFLINTIMNLVKLIELMKFSLQSYINHESVAEVHIIIVYIDTLTNIKQLNHRKNLGEMSRFIAKPLYERLSHIYYMVIKIHSSLMF